MYGFAPNSLSNCFEALQYGHQDLLKTATMVVSIRGGKLFERWTRDVPTALSSMMPCALVFAADIAAGLTLEPKKRRRKEILGDLKRDLETIILL